MSQLIITDSCFHHFLMLFTPRLILSLSFLSTSFVFLAFEGRGVCVGGSTVVFENPTLLITLYFILKSSQIMKVKIRSEMKDIP